MPQTAEHTRLQDDGSQLETVGPLFKRTSVGHGAGRL